MDSHASVKAVGRVKGDFLLLLLSGIDEGLTPKAIAKKLGRTKQALNYHLKRMQALNVVFREQSYPWAIYRLTSLGRRVKDSLIQSDNPMRRLWKAHNLITGFSVHSFGSFNFVETSNRHIAQMNGWNYAYETLGDYNIHVQDTGLLKIYCPKEYCRDPDIAFGKMFAESQRIAQLYADRYDMKLEPMRIIRKGEKSLCNSEQLSKIFGRFKLPGVYVNASDGSEELEESQDSYAVENLLKLPEKINAIEQHQLGQSQILSSFTEQISLHLKVEDRTLEKLDNDIAIQKETMKTLQEIRDAIRNFNFPKPEGLTEIGGSADPSVSL